MHFHCKQKKKKWNQLVSLFISNYKIKFFIFILLILVTLQCWDADLVSSDDYLGNVQINLTKMTRGAKSSKNCNLSMLKNKKRSKINLFKVKKHKGWWPFYSVDQNKNIKLTVI